jgi:phosphoribosylaminoimidazole carboxylase PurE protein
MTKVAVIMGSISDTVMQDAIDILKSFDMLKDIVSVHRTPRNYLTLAITHKRGITVIIAGAGAAHLPGMVSMSPLPVIEFL